MPVGIGSPLVYQPRQVGAPGASIGGWRVEFSSVPCRVLSRRAGRQGKAMATTTGNAQPEALADGEGVRRRDFIEIAAVSAAGIGGLATLVCPMRGTP